MFRPVLTRSARPLAQGLRSKAPTRSYAAASSLPFDWEDPLRTKDLLTEDEIAIMDTAERYCQERLLPRVTRRSTLLLLPPAPQQIGSCLLGELC